MCESDFIFYSCFSLVAYFFQSDDIGRMIDEAKRKAASANETASTTMDKLNDIKKEIDKISISPVDSNLSGVLDSVDQSGEILKQCCKHILWYSTAIFASF